MKITQKYCQWIK